jgi:hypothetical protein
MANGKLPETQGEHIVALYGHIEGLKTANDNFHEDLHRVERKMDLLDQKMDDTFKKMYWYLISSVATILSSLIALFNIFR